MIQYDVECPFCGRSITISETTTAQQRSAGLVYLTTKCAPCDSRIDAAGVGENGARVVLAERLRERIGTRPERWRIQPSGRTRRRGRMR